MTKLKGFGSIHQLEFGFSSDENFIRYLLPYYPTIYLSQFRTSRLDTLLYNPHEVVVQFKIHSMCKTCIGIMIQ